MFKEGQHYSRTNEMQILGVLMLFYESGKFIDQIRPEWFYDDRNRLVFETITRLKASGTFSITSVFTALSAAGYSRHGTTNMAWHLTKCTDQITGVYGFRYGLAMLQGMYRYRQIETKAASNLTINSTDNLPSNDFE